MRLRSSSTCRQCRTPLADRWLAAELASDRNDLQRQIDAGECWPCQWRRQLAAVDYMRHADDVRLLQQVARARNDPPARWVSKAHRRGVETAAAALTAAGMRDVRSTWDRRRRRETWH